MQLCISYGIGGKLSGYLIRRFNSACSPAYCSAVIQGFGALLPSLEASLKRSAGQTLQKIRPSRK
jgi:hypothetical protein